MRKLLAQVQVVDLARLAAWIVAELLWWRCDRS